MAALAVHGVRSAVAREVSAARRAGSASTSHSQRFDSKTFSVFIDHPGGGATLGTRPNAQERITDTR
jgi:hypothetical protein